MAPMRRQVSDSTSRVSLLLFVGDDRVLALVLTPSQRGEKQRSHREPELFRRLNVTESIDEEPNLKSPIYCIL
jgi:hypothetical protein